VIPVFKKLLTEGRTLQVTHKDMTRFFLSLDQAVDLIFKALGDSVGGKIFIPKVKAARLTDLASCLIDEHTARTNKKTQMYEISSIRPGEKLDEILVSEEEMFRTEDRGDIYVIHDIKSNKQFSHLTKEYSSRDDLMAPEELYSFLEEHGVL
jgi:UDP-glucose 4-epimerase